MKRLLLVAIFAVCSAGPAKTPTPRLAASSSATFSRTAAPAPTTTATVVSRPVPYVGNRILYLASSGTFGNGSGAKAPLDASTQSKYDAIIHGNQQNTTFYYAPGAYLTNGAAAGASCQHFGAGIDKTILRMNPSGSGLIFSGFNVNGFQAWNMTLDCNANSGAGHGNSSGANVVGSNLLFKNLKVIGYGTKSGAECFVLYSAPSGTNEPPNSQFSHVHVENCQFTRPATGNTGGVSLVYLGTDAQNGVKLTDAAILNCIFDTPGDFRWWNCMYGTDCENNTIEGDPASKAVQTGWCTEPGSWNGLSTHQDAWNTSFLIKNNDFIHCRSGVVVGAHPNGAVGPITVTGNRFEFTNGRNAGEVAVALIASTGSFGDIPVVTSFTITNNQLAGANGGVVYYGLVNIGGSNPDLPQGGVTTLTLMHNTVDGPTSSNDLGTIAIHLKGNYSFNISNNTFSNGTIIPVTNH